MHTPTVSLILSRIQRIRHIPRIRCKILILIAAALTAASCAASPPSAAVKTEQERFITAQAKATAARAESTLAILPFTGGEGDEGESIAELFSFEKELASVFTLIPRTAITHAMSGGRDFQVKSKMIDSDAMAALGKQLGAKYVLAGAITSLGDKNLLIISILHVEELRQIAGDIQTYTGRGEIDGKLPAMAKAVTDAFVLDMDAPQLPLLAVPPIQLLNGKTGEADMLTHILMVRLVQHGTYEVYPRTKSLEQVQRKYDNQFGGDAADEYLPRIVRGTSPRFVLSVIERTHEHNTIFNATIVNLETGTQEGGTSTGYAGFEESGIEAMGILALKLSGQEGKAAGIEAAAAEAAKVNAEETERRNPVVSDAAAFTLAIAVINNDKTNGAYTITISGSFAADAVVFTVNAEKTITLKGDGTARTISNNSNNALFTVPKGITLALENGVTLNGNGKPANVVSVKEGGTFIMKSGGAVRGAKESGVYVRSKGTFTMEGGTISGNSSDRGGGVYVDSGRFTMTGGTISENSAPSGGGVYVRKDGTFIMEGGTIRGNSAGAGGGGYVDSGTFTMTGGTISGNSAESGGGVYVWKHGMFVKRGGSAIDAANSASTGNAVYVNTAPVKQRAAAAGQNVNLDSRIAGAAGGWE